MNIRDIRLKTVDTGVSIGSRAGVMYLSCKTVCSYRPCKSNPGLAP